MALNVTTAVIGSGCNTATASPSLAQWDRGQILQIEGAELPETYKVEFSNGKTLSAIPAIGTAAGVEIPDALLYDSSPITAYIVLTSEESRNREYWITIYVTPGQIPEDVQPDPEQSGVIDQLIAQLNSGVERAEAAASMLENVDAAATTLQPGSPATAEYSDGVFEFGIPEGEKGDPFTYEDFTEEEKAELVQGPILDAQTSAVAAVGDARISAVNDVNAAGTTQVENVNSAGAAQVQAVEDKGEEVIGSIPPDYSDLSAEVSDLNNAISQKAPVIINTASGDIASFADGADGMQIRKVVGTIVPQQSGTGDPSPDNVRPISGWTGVNVYGASDNLMNALDGFLYLKENYYHDALTIDTINKTVTFNSAVYPSIYQGVVTEKPRNPTTTKRPYINFKPNTRYTFIFKAISTYGVTGSLNIGVGYTDETNVGFSVSELNSDGYYVYHTTSGKTVRSLFIGMYGGNSVFYYDTFACFEGIVTYDEYLAKRSKQARIIPINWQDEVGTVYGGYIDVVSGKLVVDRKLVTYNGTNATWYAYANYEGFYTYPAGQKTGTRLKGKSNYLKVLDGTNGAVDQPLGVWIGVNSNSTFCIRLSSILSEMTVSAWNAYLAEHNLQIEYPLATPIEYTLTPHELTTLYGTNSIWTDVGEVSVDYPADTKLYIDNKIATAIANTLNA